MKKVPAAKSTILVWPNQSTLKEQQHLRDLKRESKFGKKKSEDEKQTPEQMIHSLQAVFCKGRYRFGHYPERKPRFDRHDTGKKTV